MANCRKLTDGRKSFLIGNSWNGDERSRSRELYFPGQKTINHQNKRARQMITPPPFVKPSINFQQNQMR